MLPETIKRKEYMNMLKNYPDVLKIKEMCNALGGISTKTGYKLLRENKIESIKVGRGYCITKISVADFLMRKNNIVIFLRLIPIVDIIVMSMIGVCFFSQKTKKV